MLPVRGHYLKKTTEITYTTRQLTTRDRKGPILRGLRI